MGKLSPAIIEAIHDLDVGFKKAFPEGRSGCDAQQELLQAMLTVALGRSDHLSNNYVLQTHVADLAFAAGVKESPHQTDFLLTYAKAFPTLASRTPVAALDKAQDMARQLDVLPIPAVRAFCTAMAQSAHGWLKADRLHGADVAARAVPDAALAFYADLLSNPRVRTLKQDEGLRKALMALTSHIHGFSEERKDEFRAVVAPRAVVARHVASPVKAFEDAAPSIGPSAPPATPRPVFQLLQGGRRPPEIATGMLPKRSLGRAPQDLIAAFGL